MSKIYDFVVIGGGIFGTTMAKLLKKKMPQSTIVILEKKSKLDFTSNQKYYIPVESGDKYDSQLNKSNLMNEGYEKMKYFCLENKVDFKTVGELIIAYSKEERDRMKTVFKENENFTKISLEEAKSKESLISQKKLELAEFYLLKNSALVDLNNLRKVLLSELKQINDIDFLYNTNVEKIEINSNENIKIKSKNLNDLKENILEGKFLINASGTESLNFAHQFNIMKEYSSLKMFAEYFHANVPAKEKYPNLIISTPPFYIHPGIQFFSDENENKTIGPVFNITDKSYSFFKKLKVMNEWRKVYQIFHEKKIDPQMEIKYNSKNYVSLNYMNIYGFPMVKLFNNDNKMKIEDSVMYSLSLKKFEEDVHIIKEKNSIHLLNFNLQGGFSSIISACDEAIGKL